MKLATVHVFAALVALARAAAPEARSFDYTTHLGNLSPYFKPPVPHGVKETLPEDCTVDQVMLVRLQLTCMPYSSPRLSAPTLQRASAGAHGWLYASPEAWKLIGRHLADAPARRAVSSRV